MGFWSTLGDLVARGREAFDADSRQRWSVERLWIFAGNLAERHCRETGLDPGTEPSSQLIATRNVYAHYTPGAINYDRVWADTTADVSRIANAVESGGRSRHPVLLDLDLAGEQAISY